VEINFKVFDSLTLDPIGVRTLLYCTFIPCLHDQNKSGFFRGPVFFQPIRALWRLSKLLWLAG